MVLTPKSSPSTGILHDASMNEFKSSIQNEVVVSTGQQVKGERGDEKGGCDLNHNTCRLVAGTVDYIGSRVSNLISNLQKMGLEAQQPVSDSLEKFVPVTLIVWHDAEILNNSMVKLGSQGSCVHSAGCEIISANPTVCAEDSKHFFPKFDSF